MYSLIHRTDALFLCLILFVSMLGATVVGRLCNKKWGKDERDVSGGINSLLTALFALSGFLLAFTFGLSGNRLERVRSVIEQEGNSIGTAALRADLYSDSVRQEFRTNFKLYLEAVISFYENAADRSLLIKAKADAATAAQRLWTIATQESKQPNMLIPSNQMIPALNTMFDSANSREIVLKSKVPDLILYMLFVCVLATCFIGGLTSDSFHYKEWIVIGGFALLSSLVVYTTLDLSRPMRGVIKERAGRDAIVDLRKMFE